jgi:hypothetical protein
VVLRTDEVPDPILGRDTRLGQTTWIGARKPGVDADDLYLTPGAMRTRPDRAAAAPNQGDGRKT